MSTGRTHFARNARVHAGGREVGRIMGMPVIVDRDIPRDTIEIRPHLSSDHIIGHQVALREVHEGMTEYVGGIYGARFHSGSLDLNASSLEYLEKIFIRVSMKRFKYCGDCTFDCKKVRKTECALKVVKDE